jgi:hypothetical protein
MGDDMVEFPRGRAKVFTEDEALADLRRERRHLAALARKGFLRLLARVLPKRQPPAPPPVGQRSGNELSSVPGHSPNASEAGAARSVSSVVIP